MFQMRNLDRTSTQLTALHKVLLEDLFKLSTTVYTEVKDFTNLCDIWSIALVVDLCRDEFRNHRSIAVWIFH